MYTPWYYKASSAQQNEIKQFILMLSSVIFPKILVDFPFRANAV